MTGRMMREGLGKASFWFMFVGFWVTFMPQYLLGLHGMPRRIAEYPASNGWTGLNRISTVGAYLLFTSVAIMVVNFYVSWRKPGARGAEPVGRPHPRVGGATRRRRTTTSTGSPRSARSGRSGTSTTRTTRPSSTARARTR